jgi:hypothetical protein
MDFSQTNLNQREESGNFFPAEYLTTGQDIIVFILLRFREHGLRSLGY